MARPALEIRESTQAILRSFFVKKQEFGFHWDEMKQGRYDGTLTDDGLEKLCTDTCHANDCLKVATSTSINQKLSIQAGL